VEDAVVKNVSDKAEEETEKTLNNFWENQAQKSPFAMGIDMVDPLEIPASYNFDWEYTLQMDSPQQDQDMNMVYHIKENAHYIGIKIPQAENMFTVLDTENEMTVMYMNSEGNKMVMAMKNPKSEETMDSENPYQDMKFEKIGAKNMSMVCTGIEKKPFSIATAYYQSMGGK